MITFTVPGQPVPKQRARVVNGRAYTPDRTKGHEQAIIVAAREAGYRGEPDAESEFIVLIDFYRSGRRACDLDNLAKTVLDALNKVVWKDDSQIVTMFIAKHTTEDEPWTDIEIKERRLNSGKE